MATDFVGYGRVNSHALQWNFYTRPANRQQKSQGNNIIFYIMNYKKIGFIGQGFVGGNLAFNFEERGYNDIVRYDDKQYKGNKEAIKSCDIVFVAVPTPSTPEGFDSSILRSVMSIPSAGTTIVIKSTVPPDIIRDIQLSFPDRTIILCPEFLTEATARFDTDKPERNIVGVSDSLDFKLIEKAEAVIKILPPAPYSRICTYEEAALVKYGGNCFFVVKNMFFNILYDLAESYGADWETIHDMIIHDSRINPVHTNPLHKGGRGAGGHCLLPGAKIITEVGIKNIEDIKQGENVLTHTGSFKKVLNISKRKINNLVYRIRGQGLQSFYLTDEHPVYSVISGRKYNGIKRKKINNSVLSNLKIKFNIPEHLNVGDYLSFPKFSKHNIKKIKGLSKDLCRLAGYYVAEGHSDKKRIAFSFHIDEKRYHADVAGLIKKLFGLTVKKEIRVSKNTVVLKVYSVKLSKTFRTLFGHGADRKHFPDDWLVASDNFIKEMLSGYCRGDGSFSYKNFTSATVSEKLDNQLRFLFYRLGINCNSFQQEERIDKDGQHHKKAYYILCSNILEARKVADIVGYRLNKKVKLIRNTCPYINNNILRPIREIDKIAYNGYVYNLEVERDNSYVGLDGVFHNCLIKDFAALEDLIKINMPKDCNASAVIKSNIKKNIELLSASGKDIDLLKGVYGERYAEYK